MINSNMAPRGMAVTPHHLASQSALAVLREGGNAIEAMVAAAATIAVVYPHMNGLGGDDFWLIIPPNGDPIAIDACGAAGELATLERSSAYQQIPHRGPQAANWGSGRGPGDTVWMGVIDNNGLAVSFIQSIYHEFGSGVLLPTTGIIWQNRGASFSLDPKHLLALALGKQPFHTLNPAAARLTDGRTLVYGAMGGDGQPQTQAAVFIRHIVQGLPLQQAITAPRWLLGRTWGESSDSLKLEARFGAETLDYLRQRGHQVELLPDFSEVVGHAGAIVRHRNGMLEGAFNPRSNGSAAGY
ncbi:TPA: gamma-glutamyltransferase [Yersinia enterocolitica]|nr:gamma-glutamyltransferase [Yersinia enterocolitica]